MVAPGSDAREIALEFAGAERVEVEAETGDLLLRVGERAIRQHAPFVYQESGGERREVESRYAIKEGGRVGFEVGEYDTSAPLIIDPVLVYSTYLGGSGNDSARDIKVDSSGNAYVCGETTSTNFPTANAFDSTFNTGNTAAARDAFVAKLNAAGTAFVYSTYLGGSGGDASNDIVVDSSGNTYVTGNTASTNFPIVNALQSTNGGSNGAFVTKLNAAGSALIFSTYLGGSSTEAGNGIAVDSAGNAYVTGNTASTNFLTANAFQSTKSSGTDAFMAKISGTSNPATYSITGRVITYALTGVKGVSGVSVKLTGSQTATRLTNSNGQYSFTRLTPGGNFTVTPSKTNLSFTPASKHFTNLRTNLSNVNFTVPSLTINDVTVREANSGANTTATFTLKLSPASNQAVTVKYATANGTAVAPADYTALPLTTLTFSPGQTAKTVTVAVRGDALDEAAETFKLRLSAPTKALISDPEGICTITDNDPLPTITISDARVTEPDSGVIRAIFTVKLSVASGQTVSVKYATGGGTGSTATAGTDYVAVPLTTLSFTPGQTVKTVSVQVKGDTIREASETYFVNLSGAVNGAITDAKALGTITNDD